MEGYLKVIEELIQLYPRLGGPIQNDALREYAARLERFADSFPPAFFGKGEIPVHVRNDVKCLQELLADISYFGDSLIPRSFFFIFWILVWLSATGVIWWDRSKKESQF